MRRLEDAARTIFARDGFDGARVQDIAALADSNVALINRYFGGKRGLMQALITRQVAEVKTAPLPYPPQPTLAAELRAFLRARYAADREAREMMRIMLVQLLTDPQMHASTVAAAGATEGMLADRLAALAAKGALAPGTDRDSLVRTVMLFAFSAMLMEGELLGRPAEETLALTDRVADMLGRAHGADAAHL